MLSRNTFLVLGVSSFFLVAAGCVITTEPTGGTSASTGATGTGGHGGEQAGVGGATSTGTGTGTGGATCIGETGKGAVADCDTMNITPKTHGGPAALACGPNVNEEPPGYGLCTRGFTIFTAGSAEHLQQCLAKIGVQDECLEKPLQDCVEMMFADACVADAIAAQCDGIKTQCAADAFDAVQCAKDMKPFSDAGVKEIVDCFNAANPAKSCQVAYDECYTKVMTF